MISPILVGILVFLVNLGVPGIGLGTKTALKIDILGLPGLRESPPSTPMMS